MEVVSLELAKKHLRIDDSFTEDDDYIRIIINAAKTESENYCEIKFDDVFTDGIPGDIVAANLLLIADAYDKRENRTALHQSVARNLLNPYRKWA